MDIKGDGIRNLRGKLGWSQEELARRVGVSLSSVQRWEKSGTQPSRLALRELERVLRRKGLSEGEKR
jgi:transcriptional regulator with XRE-family HTH domain